MNTHEMSKQNMICRTLAGSHAYGTNIATSDVDYRGLFFAPPEYIRTPFHNISEVTDGSEEDTKYYEVSQFLKLFVMANPNILELAFVDRSSLELTSNPYEAIRAAAPALLSKKVAFTFSGYAISQLKRIKGHNKWINNPQPEAAPVQSSYLSLVHNFTLDKLFKIDPTEYNHDHALVHYGNDIYAIFPRVGHQLFNKDGTLKVYAKEVTTTDPMVADQGLQKVPKFLMKFNKDHYDQEHDSWKNYWNWKKNRNETRSSLEEHFGYDTKHAMHLVRLLNMGEEILTTGEVHVLRPDAALLLDIRAGKWSYDDLLAFATEKDNDIRGKHYKNSQLPIMPDMKLATKLLMDIQDMCWSGDVQLRKVIK